MKPNNCYLHSNSGAVVVAVAVNYHLKIKAHSLSCTSRWLLKHWEWRHWEFGAAEEA